MFSKFQSISSFDFDIILYCTSAIELVILLLFLTRFTFFSMLHVCSNSLLSQICVVFVYKSYQKCCYQQMSTTNTKWYCWGSQVLPLHYISTKSIAHFPSLDFSYNRLKLVSIRSVKSSKRHFTSSLIYLFTVSQLMKFYWIYW